MTTNTSNRRNLLLFAILSGTGCGSIPPPSPLPSPLPGSSVPVVTRTFLSSSGNTFIQYYTYASGSCGLGANCDFRGVIHTKSGYDQAEVFLTGFFLEAQTSAARVQGIKAEVQKFRYESTTGEMEIGVNGGLQAGQSHSYEISLVVLLTSNAVAKFTHVGNGCGGVAQCYIPVSSWGAVPSGMHYIGLGTRTFFLGTNSGPINVNTLSIHQDGLSVQPTGDVHIKNLCAFRDAHAAGKMFCEWAASIIAFDPAEMDRNDSSLFPQYTHVGNGTSVAQHYTEVTKPFSGGVVSGYFDAFEGISLFYNAGQEHSIWLIDASASDFQTIGSPATSGTTQYGIFMGTAFGDKTTAQPYNLQLSRAVGLLR